MRLFLLAALAASCFASPTAGAADPAPLEAVSTLAVDTRIEVDAQGRLATLAIDTPMPEPMRANLEARVRAWRFTPVTIDGVAHAASARLAISLSAREGEGGYVVRVDQAAVRDVATAAGPLPVPPPPVAAVEMVPPRYPSAVLRFAEVPGRVLLAVLVDAGGKVVRTDVVQSNVFDVNRVNANVRSILYEFERASRQAVGKWRFEVAADAAATAGGVPVLVPIGFGQHRPRDAQVGAWRHQVRTARVLPDWMEEAPARPLTWGFDGPIPGAGPLALVDEVAGTNL